MPFSAGAERRPRGIRSVAGRWNALLVATGDVDGEELRAGIPPGIPEDNDDAAIGGERRSFVVKAFGQYALAAAIGPHDANGEFAGADLGEGDVVTAW